MSDFNLQEFQLAELAELDQARILVIGTPGAGKSWVVRHFLQFLQRDLSYALAMSKSEASDPFYQLMIPHVFTSNNFSSERIGAFDAFATKQNSVAEMQGKPPVRGALIIDDCSSEKDLLNEGQIFDIATNGRHNKCHLILILHYLMIIKPQLREQFNYILVFATDSKDTIDKIYKNFGGVFGSAKAFNKALRHYTRDHKCLVIRTRPTKNNTLQEKVFWFKAEPIPKPKSLARPEYQVLSQILLKKAYKDHKRRIADLKNQKEIGNDEGEAYD